MKLTYTTKMKTPTELAPGIHMVLPVKATFTGIDIEGAAYDVEMVLDMTSEGVRPHSVKVTTQDGSPPITGTTLRSIRVWDLARQVIVGSVAKGTQQASSLGSLSDEAVDRLRKQGPVDESLEWAAYFYNLGLVLGLPPAKQVEGNLGLPRTTATKWIKRAREKGLLGTTSIAPTHEQIPEGMTLEETKAWLDKRNRPR